MDDEPVPGFVYSWQQGKVVSLRQNFGLPGGIFGLPPHTVLAGKSGPLPEGDPAVTMRLETPVLYIYPPKGAAAASVPPLDVQVWFHGGYLSQYYPYAETGCATRYSWIGAPGKGPPESFKMSAMTSSLDWKNVRLGSKATPVETLDQVWITPREVSAPLLEVKVPSYDGKEDRNELIQTEHFLFYRGVGHFDSPLRYAAGIDSVRSQDSSQPLGNYSDSWLVDIRADQTCAFLPHYTERHRQPFSKDQYSVDNLEKLKSSMHDALVKEGLYDDEATAMLKTWELSYFKSSGLRFFYIVPRAWTDKVLPLKITGAPAEITRVMMGRIELISDSQRATLARLAAGPCPDIAAIKAAANDALNKSKLTFPEKPAYYNGEKSLADLGIALTPPVKDYLGLGRFRDALIVHEQRQHPSAALAQFIKENGLVEK